MKHTTQLFVFLIASLGVALVAQAQVDCSLLVDAVPRPAQAGAKTSAMLTVAIARGWHISSLTQPDGGPVRTDITLSDSQPLKLAGDILAPKPHVEHSAAFGINVESYTGTVVFTLPLIATEDIKPGTKLTVEITYQACNDETCLLPKTEKVSCIIGEAMPPTEKPPSAPAKKS